MKGDLTYKPEDGLIVSVTSSALEKARQKYPDLKDAAPISGLNLNNVKHVRDSNGYTSSGDWFNSFRSYVGPNSVNNWAKSDATKQPTVRYFSGDDTLVLPFVSKNDGYYGYIAIRGAEVVGFSSSSTKSQKIDTYPNNDPIYSSDPQHQQHHPLEEDTFIRALQYAFLLGLWWKG